MKHRITSYLPTAACSLIWVAPFPGHAATMVRIQTAVDLSGVTAPQVPVSVSTGSIRDAYIPPAPNVPVTGSYSQPGEISGSPRHDAAEPERGSERVDGHTVEREPGDGGGRSHSNRPSKVDGPRGHGDRHASAPGGVVHGDSKGSIAPAPEIAFNDPGAFRFSLDAGYSSKHIWRGIDLAQFTSFNYLDPSAPKADSGVSYVAANCGYQGFGLGLKYIESVDDNFNPFYAPSASTLTSYEELIVSLNYTRMLVGDDWLQGTAGFDFYYYPTSDFWGVSNQGMFYANFSSPHYKWARPFLNLFYNVATDSSGSGLAATRFRGEGGSSLVEGCGAEFGVNGGDRVWSNDYVSVAATYSASAIVKQGYQFEDDGFSHLALTVGLPVSVGEHLTITPSVSYIEAVGDVTPIEIRNAATGKVFLTGPQAASLGSAWNEPGWVATIKASWQF